MNSILLAPSDIPLDFPYMLMIMQKMDVDVGLIRLKMKKPFSY